LLFKGEIMPFNTKDNRKIPRVTSGPLVSMPIPDTTTYNGAAGFSYEDKSALFLLATNSMFGQDKFYESAKQADDRFVELVRRIARADAAWTFDFITWLRQSGNMRTGAVVASVEACLATKGFQPAPGQQGISRRLARAGLGRADEIGEAVGYFTKKYPGQQIPKPLKRGWADAMADLFNEYSAMKYGNSDKKEYTPDRLLNLLHPVAKAPWQSDLFGYLVARKYGEVEIPASLKTLRTRAELMDRSVNDRRAFLTRPNAAEVLKAAGMTWEALAGWLQGPMDAQAWQAIIPNMGYFALLRNLRNFDQAGIDNRTAAYVLGKLSSEEEVKRSKIFPFRFLAAHRNVLHSRWASALSMALDASLGNIPKLSGRTLILVDTSGSMNYPFSEHSEMKRWDAASLFGIALAKTCESVDLYSYASGYGKWLMEYKVTKGRDVLSEVDLWQRLGYNIGGGTPTAQAVQATYKGHDRVIILTDEQANYAGVYGVDKGVPADKHFYTFNLAGYRQAHAPTGKFRHSFGGLTDACFPLMSMIEEGTAGRWPWEMGN
jgi:hypothetical protein